MKLPLSILFAILICDQVVNGYRILGIFPFSGKSHWLMNEELMKALAKRGHQVDVVTHFSLKKPILNYTEINLAGSVPLYTNNLTATTVKQFSGDPILELRQIGNKMCQLMNHPKIRELIENPPQNPPYDIVIIELFVSPCYLAFGRHLKVPIVGTVISVFHDWLSEVSGNPMNLAYIPGWFTTYTQHMSFTQRLVNVLLSNYISAQIQYDMNSQLEFVKKHFGINVPHIKELYRDVALYLVNSHHSLHGIRPMTTNVIEVGGLHLKDDDPLPLKTQKWLDESKDGCIYFTFGSMVKIETFPKETIEQFYASFKKIAPIRVLMKVVKKGDLLPGLPKNVMTQSWFPQISVLKHKNIRGFITHGGGSGTQEAIYCGVPMIGIPLFGDQNVNIQNYVNKKVAVAIESIDDITEEKLTSALNKILKDPSYYENAQRLSKLYIDRPMSALNTSVFWVEYIAKYGNVLQSPAIDLYWWQLNLLDVYVFILVVIIIALTILLFVLRKLKNILFDSLDYLKKNSVAIKFKKNK